MSEHVAPSLLDKTATRSPRTDSLRRGRRFGAELVAVLSIEGEMHR